MPTSSITSESPETSPTTAETSEDTDMTTEEPFTFPEAPDFETTTEEISPGTHVVMSTESSGEPESTSLTTTVVAEVQDNSTTATELATQTSVSETTTAFVAETSRASEVVPTVTTLSDMHTDSTFRPGSAVTDSETPTSPLASVTVEEVSTTETSSHSETAMDYSTPQMTTGAYTSIPVVSEVTVRTIVPAERASTDKITAVSESTINVTTAESSTAARRTDEVRRVTTSVASSTTLSDRETAVSTLKNHDTTETITDLMWTSTSMPQISSTMTRLVSTDKTSAESATSSTVTNVHAKTSSPVDLSTTKRGLESSSVSKELSSSSSTVPGRDSPREPVTEIPAVVTSTTKAVVRTSSSTSNMATEISTTESPQITTSEKSISHGDREVTKLSTFTKNPSPTAEALVLTTAAHSDMAFTTDSATVSTSQELTSDLATLAKSTLTAFQSDDHTTYSEHKSDAPTPYSTTFASLSTVPDVFTEELIIATSSTATEDVEKRTSVQESRTSPTLASVSSSKTTAKSTESSRERTVTSDTTETKLSPDTLTTAQILISTASVPTKHEVERPTTSSYTTGTKTLTTRPPTTSITTKESLKASSTGAAASHYSKKVQTDMSTDAEIETTDGSSKRPTTSSFPTDTESLTTKPPTTSITTKKSLKASTTDAAVTVMSTEGQTKLSTVVGRKTTDWTSGRPITSSFTTGAETRTTKPPSSITTKESLKTSITDAAARRYSAEISTTVKEKMTERTSEYPERTTSTPSTNREQSPSEKVRSATISEITLRPRITTLGTSLPTIVSEALRSSTIAPAERSTLPTVSTEKLEKVISSTTVRTTTAVFSTEASSDRSSERKIQTPTTTKGLATSLATDITVSKENEPITRSTVTLPELLFTTRMGTDSGYSESSTPVTSTIFESSTTRGGSSDPKSSETSTVNKDIVSPTTENAVISKQEPQSTLLTDATKLPLATSASYQLEKTTSDSTYSIYESPAVTSTQARVLATMRSRAVSDSETTVFQSIGESTAMSSSKSNDSVKSTDSEVFGSEDEESARTLYRLITSTYHPLMAGKATTLEASDGDSLATTRRVKTKSSEGYKAAPAESYSTVTTSRSRPRQKLTTEIPVSTSSKQSLLKSDADTSTSDYLNVDPKEDRTRELRYPGWKPK